MLQGSCLCGRVRFEINAIAGPFELCHCRRCRKTTGSAFLAGLYVKRSDLHFLQGIDSIQTYEAPILEKPPAYKSSFCRNCGSPTPDPADDSAFVEVPAGTLETDPGLRPDKHIFIEFKAPWFEIKDDLPRYDKVELRKLRSAQVPSK